MPVPGHFSRIIQLISTEGDAHSCFSVSFDGGTFYLPKFSIDVRVCLILFKDLDRINTSDHYKLLVNNILPKNLIKISLKSPQDLKRNSYQSL